MIVTARVLKLNDDGEYEDDDMLQSYRFILFRTAVAI